MRQWQKGEVKSRENYFEDIKQLAFYLYVRKKGKLTLQNTEGKTAETIVLRYRRRMGSGKEVEIRKALH